MDGYNGAVSKFEAHNYHEGRIGIESESEMPKSVIVQDNQQLASLDDYSLYFEL